MYIANAFYLENCQAFQFHMYLKRWYELILKYYLCFLNILQKSKFSVGQRVIEFALEKKDREGPYWTRLVKDAKKQHWLKVDFSKWRDEDESDEEAGGGEGLEQVSLF
jgi:hypothetical protein